VWWSWSLRHYAEASAAPCGSYTLPWFVAAPRIRRNAFPWYPSCLLPGSYSSARGRPSGLGSRGLLRARTRVATSKPGHALRPCATDRSHKCAGARALDGLRRCKASLAPPAAPGWCREHPSVPSTRIRGVDVTRSAVEKLRPSDFTAGLGRVAAMQALGDADISSAECICLG